METLKIVRSNGAGVFFGEIKEKDGDRVVMTNARRQFQKENDLKDSDKLTL